MKTHFAVFSLFSLFLTQSGYAQNAPYPQIKVYSAPVHMKINEQMELPFSGTVIGPLLRSQESFYQYQTQQQAQNSMHMIHIHCFPAGDYNQQQQCQQNSDGTSCGDLFVDVRETEPVSIGGMLFVCGN